MIIALKSEEHGTHICYSDAEAKELEKAGWKRDLPLSDTLAGIVPSPPTEIKRGPGRPRKDEAA
ncbi:MAG: hypothetical protein Q7N50_02835 [Armatimonadota bacterium]|nr:hypothetical protein [Armatimonadota bacterium]